MSYLKSQVSELEQESRKKAFFRFILPPCPWHVIRWAPALFRWENSYATTPQKTSESTPRPICLSSTQCSSFLSFNRRRSLKRQRRRPRLLQPRRKRVEHLTKVFWTRLSSILFHHGRGPWCLVPGASCRVLSSSVTHSLKPRP